MGTNITGIGNANAIGFKSRVTGGMYFPPELKDALVGVWSAYGKSNDSTDRNIIKNKIKDRGGDFELINFNYEGTSGYNGYPVVFGKDKTYQYVNHSPNYNQTTINVTHFNTRQALLYSYIQRNGELTSYNRDYPSYKIKVSGLEEGFGLMYQYNSKADATSVNALRIETNGIYTIPKSFASDGSLTNANIWVGFVFTGTEQEQCNVTIEVLPEYKGAVVTDGVDDMIVSQNTVEEMGITDKFTVVSMIHQITLRGATAAALTNYIRQPIGHEYVRNHVANIGKTGIYGYAVYDVNHSSAGNSHIINTILGDKNDYSIHIAGNLSQGKFSVQGYINGDNNAVELSQVAWYWTFIANKLLTEDEINLIIEKYNLDRPGEIVKPDVYYDIKRQKITNENHSSFDDELTDFSGNGHNMKLYNIAWEGNSGIGNYPVIFGANKTWEYMPTYNFIYSNSGSKIHITKVLHAGNGMLFSYAKINDVLQNIKEIPSFKVKVSGLEGNSTLRYSYIKTEDAKYQSLFDLNNGVHEVPKSLVPTDAIVNNTWIGFTIMPIYEEVREFDCDITIEVIPSDENTICLDGVDDYGKVTGLPILKDYTVAADYIRTFAKESAQDSPILSKSKVQGAGAFLFNFLDANSRQATFSFGKNTGLTERVDDSKRSIYYQSKYINNGNDITAGTAIDYEDMWLGTYRDNTSNFFTGALYFAMLFPYSLSEFLLERQIKKARTGTLYPNQVEFRPIIPEDENITKIDYFVVNSGVWTVIKPGDYVDVGARIVLNVYTKLPYKIEKVSSLAFTGMSVEPSTGLNIFDIKGYIKDKTPQKIKITLAVNEDIVQWNPTITSNLLDSFTASSWYLNGWDNTITTGTWIKKTDRVFFKATFKTELYGLETATFGGAECVVSKADNWSDSTNIWDIRMLGTVGDLSQVFNLDVYELIRFEDIVQPYPAFYEFTDEDKNLVTWGSKVKVGTTITRIKAFVDSNLLKDLYTISYPKLNGVASAGSNYVVERQMVFTCTATYLLDDNEPKCILSPSRLRIPNSSYKILGYIPDISGHGNHGKINNSAYAGMSGANGYPYDYSSSSFTVNTNLARKLNGEKVEYFAIGVSEGFIYNDKTYKGKVKITGVSKAISNNEIYNFRIYSNTSEHIESSEYITITEDGIYDIDIKGTSQDASKVNFFAVTKFSDVVKLGTPITIEQVGEYEGAYCLDSVDDFITIPTLSSGGKQVLMKVNLPRLNEIIYDQRKETNTYTFAILTTPSQIAYNQRNSEMITYIDGILNTNIIAKQLMGVTHNIVAINSKANLDNTRSPILGRDINGNNWSRMRIYDFMLFDEISADEEIKELNNIVGIEGDYVQKPSYYWDAYGKSNLDADKGYIKDQVSLQLNNDTTNNNSLENFNFGYEGMSGYNGYPVVFGESKTWEAQGTKDGDKYYIYTSNANKFNITQIKISSSLFYTYIKRNGELTSGNKDISSFNLKVTGLDYDKFYLAYYYLKSADVEVKNVINITSDGIYELPKSFASDGSLTETNSYIGLSFIRKSSEIPDIIQNVNVTIEVLPEYKNGLVYDGVDDYSENASIPLLSDYTYIFKRTLLNKKYNSGSMFKGNNSQTGGGAFICDYNSVEPDLQIQGFSFGRGITVDSLNTNSIVYGTRDSVNGTEITAGSNTDTEGLTVGKWRAYKEMVFYKLFLYPRTVNMLSINMVKNMMEEDGIIDLTSKLFTDKYTGDFYEMDFNNDFLIGN